MREAVERTCIVTRKVAEPDDLIRFVVGPDDCIVPDLKRSLPGRGCWVGLDRTKVEKAAAKKLFARAFKQEVSASADLGLTVDLLLSRSALGSLGLARKAGQVALGATKVESAIRAGEAVLVLHAFESAEDGSRKLSQARRATVHAGGPAIPAYKLFAEADLSLALGGANVIHAAVLAGNAGRAVLKRMVALDRYRGGSPDDLAGLAVVADEGVDAEDIE